MQITQLQKQQLKKTHIFFSLVFILLLHTEALTVGDNGHQEHCFTGGNVPESFACSKLGLYSQSQYLPWVFQQSWNACCSSEPGFLSAFCRF